MRSFIIAIITTLFLSACGGGEDLPDDPRASIPAPVCEVDRTPCI